MKLSQSTLTIFDTFDQDKRGRNPHRNRQTTLTYMPAQVHTLAVIVHFSTKFSSVISSLLNANAISYDWISSWRWKYFPSQAWPPNPQIPKFSVFHQMAFSKKGKSPNPLIFISNLSGAPRGSGNIQNVVNRCEYGTDPQLWNSLVNKNSPSSSHPHTKPTCPKTTQTSHHKTCPSSYTMFRILSSYLCV